MQEYPITIHQHSGCGLPPRILLQIRILRFFTLRNREEIHLIIPTSFFYLTFIRISIIEEPAGLRPAGKVSDRQRR